VRSAYGLIGLRIGFQTEKRQIRRCEHIIMSLAARTAFVGIGIGLISLGLMLTAVKGKPNAGGFDGGKRLTQGAQSVMWSILRSLPMHQTLNPSQVQVKSRSARSHAPSPQVKCASEQARWRWRCSTTDLQLERAAKRSWLAPWVRYHDDHREGACTIVFGGVGNGCADTLSLFRACPLGGGGHSALGITDHWCLPRKANPSLRLDCP
jgi:hypothetical protein